MGISRKAASDGISWRSLEGLLFLVDPVPFPSVQNRPRTSALRNQRRGPTEKPQKATFQHFPLQFVLGLSHGMRGPKARLASALIQTSGEVLSFLDDPSACVVPLIGSFFQFPGTSHSIRLAYGRNQELTVVIPNFILNCLQFWPFLAGLLIHETGLALSNGLTENSRHHPHWTAEASVQVNGIPTTFHFFFENDDQSMDSRRGKPQHFRPKNFRTSWNRNHQAVVYLGVSENSVPLNPMVNDG